MYACYCGWKGNTPKRDTGAFVECPICSRPVTFATINREAPTEPPRRKPNYLKTVRDVLDRARDRKDVEFLHAVACDLLQALEAAHADMATYEMAQPSDYFNSEPGVKR